MLPPFIEMDYAQSTSTSYLQNANLAQLNKLSQYGQFVFITVLFEHRSAKP